MPLQIRKKHLYQKSDFLLPGSVHTFLQTDHITDSVLSSAPGSAPVADPPIPYSKADIQHFLTESVQANVPSPVRKPSVFPSENPADNKYLHQQPQKSNFLPLAMPE